VLVAPVGGQLLLPEGEPAEWLAALAASRTGEPTNIASRLSVPREHVVGPHSVCEGDSPQYSGYLPAGPDAAYFFWLAEHRGGNSGTELRRAGDAQATNAQGAKTRDDFANGPITPEAPLILWLSGGPGCASSLALLAENGPCLAQNRNGTNAVKKNTWSWTEVANVVWVDQPASVGFSVGSAPHSITNESGVASHMAAFIHSFYARFPRFLATPLFLFGESYAGHYIPAIAAALLRNTSRFSANDVRIPLAGIALGNAMVNPAVQWETNALFAYTGGHSAGGSLPGGFVPKQEYLEMKSSLPVCEKDLKSCQRAEEAGTDSGYKCNGAVNACLYGEVAAPQMVGLNPYDVRERCTLIEPPVPCIDLSAETVFLNQPATQEALGIPTYLRPFPWKACNSELLNDFISSGDYLMSFESEVAEILAADIPVLVYSGDTDAMCNWLGCRLWVERLQWPHQRDWESAAELDFTVGAHGSGGRYTAAGREKSLRGLTFLQIYDAGHMVPSDQPEAALAMVSEFISPSSRWAMAPPVPQSTLPVQVLAAVAVPAADPVMPIVMASLAFAAVGLFLTRTLSWYVGQCCPGSSGVEADETGYMLIAG